VVAVKVLEIVYIDDNKVLLGPEIREIFIMKLLGDLT